MAVFCTCSYCYYGPTSMLLYADAGIALRRLKHSFINFHMQIVRKQDHESWKKIAVNLGKKIKYAILKSNYVVFCPC